EPQIDATLAEWKKEVVVRGVHVVHTQRTIGLPHDEILKIAEEGSYGLIVIGTHGRTGLDHLLIGSVAEPGGRRRPRPGPTRRPRPHGPPPRRAREEVDGVRDRAARAAARRRAPAARDGRAGVDARQPRRVPRAAPVPAQRPAHLPRADARALRSPRRARRRLA